MADLPIGILGGTFDPVHTAHVRLAEEAVRQLRLGSVIWVPAGNPYHRQPPVAHPEQRLAMVQLATLGHPEFRVDAGEVGNTGPTYTVPTLERLRRDLGDSQPLVLLTGADAFLGMSSWHRWHDLFQLAHIAIASRPGFPLDVNAMPSELVGEYLKRRRSQFTALATAPTGAIFEFPLSAGTVSSTEVRSRLRSGQGAEQLLPAPVLDYIRQHHLYSD